MKRWKNQRGVALLFSLFTLFLLTAIAFGMVFMTNTETSVDSNYRSDQALYFAAKAGLEEARNRMMLSNPNSLFNCAGGANTCLPATAMPPGGGNNYQILYMVGGTSPGTVNWASSTSPYFDNELCHDAYTAVGIYPQSYDVPCQNTLPTPGTWYSTRTSVAPFAGTSAALMYQWARVAPKLNTSVQSYPVNSGATPTGLVCFDGQEEIVLTPGLSDCSKMPSLNPPGGAATPVYMITSLAVNPITSARRMVQAEVALAPAPPFPYGLFATGTSCGAVTLGGGANTDSYTTANGGTYTPQTAVPTGGDVGSNGNVSASGNTKIGGSVGVPTPTQGACPGNGFTTSGGAGMVPNQNPPNQLQQIQPYTFPVPPPLNPAPPTTTYTAGNSMLPGTYGNVVVSSGTNLVLTAGTYNINSITLNGNATITISGPVVINVAGAGQSTPISLTGSGSGNAFNNTTGIPNNFQINYGGTGTVKISGGSQASIIVNAPQADIMLKGGSDVFGAFIGKTIDDSGGVKFHYDRNTKFGPPNLGTYSELSFRELMY